MTSFPSAPEVCLAITRKLRRSRTGPAGSPLLTVFPELTAEAVMGVVQPALEDRDREIARLSEALGWLRQHVDKGKSSSGEGER